jgi:hypothetical protein
MIIAPKTTHETERLAALGRYAVLDTPPEPQFDDLTRLAAHICGTPMALICLLDEHRQWFKARVGLEVTETPREIAFCTHTILQDRVLIVPDTHCDERFHDNPLVTGTPGIRFYAGMPLLTADAQPLGTLCVLDRQARGLSPARSEALQVLARQVMSQLELRRHIAAWSDAMAEAHATQAQLVTVSRQAGLAEVATGVLHNVGNVLNSVNVYATWVADKLKQSHCDQLAKIVAMLREHEADLGTFLTKDAQGRQVPAYLHALAERLEAEQAALRTEMRSLQKSLGHVKDVVAMQQNYAKVSGVTEPVPVEELLEDTLNLNAAALNCDDIRGGAGVYGDSDRAGGQTQSAANPGQSRAQCQPCLRGFGAAGQTIDFACDQWCRARADFRGGQWRRDCPGEFEPHLHARFYHPKAGARLRPA